MADLICVAFDQPDTADKVLHALTAMSKEQLIDLEDACVVVRPAEGEPQIKQMMPLTKIGALSGGSSGALVGCPGRPAVPQSARRHGDRRRRRCGHRCPGRQPVRLRHQRRFHQGPGQQDQAEQLGPVPADPQGHRRQGARAAQAEGFTGHVLQTNADQRAGRRAAQGDRRRAPPRRPDDRPAGAGTSRRRPPLPPRNQRRRRIHGEPEPGRTARAGAATAATVTLWANATQTVFGEGPADARDPVRRRAARATRRTGRGARSSAPPASCSIGRWPRPASTARRSTSPTRSSTSSSSRAASAASTRSPTTRRCSPASPGWRASSRAVTAAARRGPGRHRRAVADRPHGDHRQGARPLPALSAGPAPVRHRAPVLPAAAARRAGAGGGVSPLRRGAAA